MAGFLLLALFFAVLPAGPAHRLHAQSVDAVQHVGAGFSAGLAATAVLVRRDSDPHGLATAGAAFAAGSLAGVAKELFDIVGAGSSELRDLGYTVVGAGLSSLVSAVITELVLPGGPSSEPSTPPPEERRRAIGTGLIVASAAVAAGVVALEVREQLQERREEERRAPR